ncbi:MAG: DUF58 domain-containing protein [Deltaproteobacteria bacterium]|nr:DUF58 domain-containing protein [Deltaproteobacteria bacterium]
MVTTPRHRHLDGEALAKLGNLQLRVQAVVEGSLAGLHRSPHHGSSIEFAEHKEYAPGDDIRRIDWKAYARFDRYYVRQFEDETELRAYFLLDASGSMGYGAPLSKLEYGSVLVASLAYLLARQRDQPSLLAFAEDVRCYLPPRGRTAHLSHFLTALEELAPSGRTDLGRAIHYLTDVIGRRSFVLVVSDLFDAHPDALRLLRQLRARGHRVVLFHLLHEDELGLPFGDLTLFEAMEDTRAVLVDPGGIRKLYLKEMERFLERTREACRQGEIGYHQISPGQPVDQVLLRFLSSKRGRR